MTVTDPRPMQHSDFVIGETIWFDGRTWRCTDIGTRTVVAIRLDSVDVGSNAPELCRMLSQSQADAEGWFDGPPYAVAKVVFDEDALKACWLKPAEQSS